MTASYNAEFRESYAVHFPFRPPVINFSKPSSRFRNKRVNKPLSHPKFKADRPMLSRSSIIMSMCLTLLFTGIRAQIHHEPLQPANSPSSFSPTTPTSSYVINHAQPAINDTSEMDNRFGWTMWGWFALFNQLPKSLFAPTVMLTLLVGTLCLIPSITMWVLPRVGRWLRLMMVYVATVCGLGIWL